MNSGAAQENQAIDRQHRDYQHDQVVRLLTAILDELKAHGRGAIVPWLASPLPDLATLQAENAALKAELAKWRHLSGKLAKHGIPTPESQETT